MADLTIVEVGITLLVLKEFVNFSKYVIDKLTHKPTDGNPLTVIHAKDIEATVTTARDTNRMVKDVHTSVVAPDRVPLVSRVDALHKRRD